jgi:hypothetical protein
VLVDVFPSIRGVLCFSFAEELSLPLDGSAAKVCLFGWLKLKKLHCQTVCATAIGDGCLDGRDQWQARFAVVCGCWCFLFVFSFSPPLHSPFALTASVELVVQGLETPSNETLCALVRLFRRVGGALISSKQK